MNCKQALQVLKFIVFKEVKGCATSCGCHSVLCITVFFENEGLEGTLWECGQKEVL